MKPLFLIQARTGSTRYPNKIFQKIFGEFSLIDIVVKRLLLAEICEKENIVILTTTNRKDDSLYEYCIKMGLKVFRGNEENVFDRFYSFLKTEQNPPEYFFRVCSDNPFLEPKFIDKLSDEVESNPDFDYISYADYKNTPAILTHYGFFIELIKTEAFYKAKSKIEDKIQQEHVTPIFHSTDYFRKRYIKMPPELNRDDIRLTFDTTEDLEVIRIIYRELNKIDFSYKEIIDFLDSNPELFSKMKTNILSNAK